MDISNSAGFRYCKKLHVLNKNFKGWNRELFSRINNSSVALSKVVEDVDKTREVPSIKAKGSRCKKKRP